MKAKIILGLALSFILVISSISVTLVQAWYNSTDPWSQNQHDAQHTGAGTSTSPSNNSTIWTYEFIGGADARAKHLIVDDGRVFGIRGQDFFALDETTGALILYGSPGGYSYYGNVGGAYANGKIYYTSSDYIYSYGAIFCYNATTGDQLWNYTTAPGQISSPPTVSGNRVYVGTTNNYTYCIEDGVQKWSKKLGGPTSSAPAVDGDLFCIGSDDGKVYAFNIAGAQPVSLWNFTVGKPIQGPITIKDDKVYFSGGNGYLYVLNRTNGHLIWSWLSPNSEAYLYIAVADGIVYVGVRAYGWGSWPIYALYSNVTSGNYTYSSPEPRLWFDTNAAAGYNGITVSGNRVFYMAGYTNTLYARNALTSTHIWSYKLPYSSTVPIIADGHVFIADELRIFCIGEAYPPVTNTYNLNVGGQLFTVTAQTNSTMGNIDTSDVTTTKNMSFTVESQWSTGMCNITLPNALLGGPYTLTVGGLPPWSSSTTVLNATHTALYFTYNGTRKYTAMITGTTAIPEFPPSMMLALLVVSTLALALVFGKRQKLRTQ